MSKHRAWVAAAVIAVIWAVMHFGLGWSAYQHDAQSHGQTPEMREYVIEWGRDTTENLQSEFWQLAFQFAVLAGVIGAVKAYEDDQEQIKNDLAEVKKSVAGYKTDLYKIGYEMQEQNRWRR